MSSYAEHVVHTFHHVLGLTREHGVQGSLVDDDTELFVLELDHVGRVDLLEPHLWPRLLVQSPHLSDDDLAEVDARDVLDADVVQVGTERRVSASDDEDLVAGLDVLVEDTAEVAVLAVPLEGLLASALKEPVPIIRLAELLMVPGKQTHLALLENVHMGFC